MTVVLDLPDHKEAVLKAKAQAQGVSAEEYAEKVLCRDLDEPPPFRPSGRTAIFPK